jgi:release factor glutamine methyltransferase
MTTVREALADAARRLAGAGVDDAERESAWMLAHVLGTSAGGVRLLGGEPLGASAGAEFVSLVERRAAREPLQYILGTEEFMGMTFRVTPAVLIPRFDTETLVRQAAARLQGRVRVADIGTGSGAVAIGLASLLPEAQFVAVDISAEALAVARDNARANGVGDRVDFRHGDLVAPLAGGGLFDAILSNPPYIDEAEWVGLMPEVRQFEPKGALTPGPDGLVLYRRLAAEAPPLLETGGFLAVEVGFRQAGAVAEIFRSAGLAVAVVPDTAGIDRVVIGHKAA